MISVQLDCITCGNYLGHTLTIHICNILNKEHNLCVLCNRKYHGHVKDPEICGGEPFKSLNVFKIHPSPQYRREQAKVGQQ